MRVSPMNAQGVSPQQGSGFAASAAASTAGWQQSVSSTSREEMFSPPEMIACLATTPGRQRAEAAAAR